VSAASRRLSAGMTRSASRRRRRKALVSYLTYVLLAAQQSTELRLVWAQDSVHGRTTPRTVRFKSMSDGGPRSCFSSKRMHHDTALGRSNGPASQASSRLQNGQSARCTHTGPGRQPQRSFQPTRRPNYRQQSQNTNHHASDRPERLSTAFHTPSRRNYNATSRWPVQSTRWEHRVVP
jgi:hypothetical protein